MIRNMFLLTYVSYKLYITNSVSSLFLFLKQKKKKSLCHGKILNRFCICFSLVTHFPSIWVTNKSRICLCNIQRKHLSCPSQVYTNNLLLSNMFDSGCSLTKPLSDRNTCRHTKIFLKLLQPVSYLLSLFTVFLLYDSVFVLTCFNPLGVHFF